MSYLKKKSKKLVLQHEPEAKKLFAAILSHDGDKENEMMEETE